MTGPRARRLVGVGSGAELAQPEEVRIAQIEGHVRLIAVEERAIVAAGSTLVDGPVDPGDDLFSFRRKDPARDRRGRPADEVSRGTSHRDHGWKRSHPIERSRPAEVLAGAGPALSMQESPALAGLQPPSELPGSVPRATYRLLESTASQPFGVLLEGVEDRFFERHAHRACHSSELVSN